MESSLHEVLRSKEAVEATKKLFRIHKQLCFRPRVQHSVYKLIWPGVFVSTICYRLSRFSLWENISTVGPHIGHKDIHLCSKNPSVSHQKTDLAWKLENISAHRTVATVNWVNQLKDAPAAVVIGTPVASINLPNPSSSFQTVNKACTYLVKAEKGKGSEFSAVRAEHVMYVFFHGIL